MGHGSRIPIARIKGEWQPLTLGEWRSLETIMNARFSRETKERIEAYCQAFAEVGPLYARNNTVLRSQILPALSRWLKATNELLALLKIKVPPKSDFHEFTISAANFDNPYNKLDTSFPLQMISPILQLSSTAASYAHQQLEDAQWTTITDLWDVWATLIGKALTDQKIKVSVQSLNKSAKVSAFVRLIQKLQERLPDTCRTKAEDESFGKAIQGARKRQGRLRARTLELQLFLFSTQLHLGDNSLGSLRRMNPNDADKTDRIAMEEGDAFLKCMVALSASPEFAKLLKKQN